MTYLIVLNQMCLFAYDDKVYVSINSLNDRDILQHDIDRLTKWSSGRFRTLELINVKF